MENNYRVTCEEHDDEGQFLCLVIFECFADDEEHAVEQAIDMYPNAYIEQVDKI